MNKREFFEQPYPSPSSPLLERHRFLKKFPEALSYIEFHGLDNSRESAEFFIYQENGLTKIAVTVSNENRIGFVKEDIDVDSKLRESLIRRAVCWKMGV